MGTSMAAVLLLLTCLTAVQACPFATECVQKWNGTRISCCPEFNGSICGSKYNRGNCMTVVRRRTMPSPDVPNDERGDMPGFFFNATCQCKPNFMGPACGECVFGFTGDKCDQKNVVIRRDVSTLTLLEITRFLADLHYCKYKLDLEFSILTTIDRSRRSYYRFLTVSFIDHMCFIHTYITEPFITRGRESDWINYGHGSTGFFGWHRLYLLYFERQMQKCLNNPSWGLIYYSWENEDPKECRYCNNNYFGETDIYGRISPGSVLYHWRTVCGGPSFPSTVCLMNECECEREKIYRKVGQGTIFKSTAQNVSDCMNKPLDTYPFDSSATNSSRNCIEGFMTANDRPATMCHNAYHMFIGGTMSRVPTSCNDILFWLHHCNVDRFFEIYINLHGFTPSMYPADNNIYGHSGDSCIGGFLPCWRMRSMYQTISTWEVYYR